LIKRGRAARNGFALNDLSPCSFAKSRPAKALDLPRYATTTMLDELIDLTTMQPSEVMRTRFRPTDLMWIVVVGAVPYVAREAFRYLFPRRPTVLDQLNVLAELIAAAGGVKAKSLKVRISRAAKTRWEMPESIQKATVLGESADTIDLEIVFTDEFPTPSLD
jgi:hypothetical protein